jgi:hypothetical protein
MNTHKKLISLGFIKCEPHKPSDNWREPSKMVPDDTEVKAILKNGNWERYVKKKEHPKWVQFYILKFDDKLNIWIKLSRNLIDQIWLDGYDIKDEWSHRTIKEININSEKINFNSKLDIIKTLPKRLQRDLIIKEIFR